MSRATKTNKRPSAYQAPGGSLAGGGPRRDDADRLRAILHGTHKSRRRGVAGQGRAETYDLPPHVDNIPRVLEPVFNAGRAGIREPR